MASEEEMDLDGHDTGRGKSNQGVRKNIAIKLKNESPGSGKGRGRPRRTTRSGGNRTPKKKESPVAERTEEEMLEEMEEYSSMKVTSAEPTHKMQKLMWNHKVNLLGIKVVDPIIHSCDLCKLPILIYGRMIPCKHVFCLDCAKKNDKTCNRCGDPVNRVEQSALGAVFVCNYGGSKHGGSGCRRTYLSQRDLQAHINYRHLKQAESKPPPPANVPSSAPVQTSAVSSSLGVGVGAMQGVTFGMVQPAVAPMLSPNMIVGQPPPQQHRPPMSQQSLNPADANNMLYQQALAPTLHPGMVQQNNQAAPQQQMVQNPDGGYQSIPVRTSNLITVPIQDEVEYNRGGAQYPTVSSSAQYMHPPPPTQNVVTNQPVPQYNPNMMAPGIQPNNIQPGNLQGGMPPGGIQQYGGSPHAAQMGGRPPVAVNLSGVNLSQPPPSGPPVVGHASQAQPNRPMMTNRFPGPQNMYNQPPPTNQRTWNGPPSGGHMSGPPQSGHMSGPPQSGHMSGPPQSVHISGPPQSGHMSGPPPSGHMSGPPPSGHMSGPPQSGHMSGPPQSGHMSGPPPSGHMSGPPQSGHMSGPPQSGHMSGPSQGGHMGGPPPQGPPPQGGHMRPQMGGPHQRPPSSASNMGPPPQRPFYQ